MCGNDVPNVLELFFSIWREVLVGMVLCVRRLADRFLSNKRLGRGIHLDSSLTVRFLQLRFVGVWLDLQLQKRDSSSLQRIHLMSEAYQIIVFSFYGSH